jgi:hypothetical protein
VNGNLHSRRRQAGHPHQPAALGSGDFPHSDQRREDRCHRCVELITGSEMTGKGSV